MISKGPLTLAKFIIKFILPSQIGRVHNEICTINVSQGLFKMFMLTQGLKSSSAIFQIASSQLSNISGV